MPDRPKFIHNCSKCIFLGHFDLHDLYVCTQGPGLRHVVARFDHDDLDYKSGLASACLDKHLNEAYKRARDAGLLDKSDSTDFKGVAKTVHKHRFRA